jgi:hypothetical protein
MIRIQNLLQISTSKFRCKKQKYHIELFFSYRKQNILQEFHGRESDKIWPEVKKYLDRVLNEPPARKQAA